MREHRIAAAEVWPVRENEPEVARDAQRLERRPVVGDRDELVALADAPPEVIEVACRLDRRAGLARADDERPRKVEFRLRLTNLHWVGAVEDDQVKPAGRNAVCRADDFGPQARAPHAK